MGPGTVYDQRSPPNLKFTVQILKSYPRHGPYRNPTIARHSAEPVPAHLIRTALLRNQRPTSIFHPRQPTMAAPPTHDGGIVGATPIDGARL
jgi:hypothetical protein